MKRILVSLCIALLPITAMAQLDCNDIDMICNSALEWASSGQYTKALEGLRNAKKLPELRNCSNIYRIDNTISTIQRIQSGEIMSIRVGNVYLNMVRVDGGTFTMGATSEQGKIAWDDEKPTHSVTLSSYYIGETEVTQELWEEVMGSNPSKFKGSHRPVDNVSWEDCQDFIRRLNQRTGKNFRLPTEAEWEYAARGGRKSYGYMFAGGNNIDDVAWYEGNSRVKSSYSNHIYQSHSPVAQKRANELGIYDMSGNVSEWCSDWYGKYKKNAQTNPTGSSSGSIRVNRGGSWYDPVGSCRVSKRYHTAPNCRYDYYGLRLAL